jgi:hypothetical protein
MVRRRFLLVVLPGLLGLCSCTDSRPGPEFKKETAPVMGQVLVDGSPPPASSPIQIHVHAVGEVSEVDKEHPSVSSGGTGEDGKFELSTYEKGDGVPLGDYVLTFTWRDFNLMKKQYLGPDKFKNRYVNPKTSEVKFSVEEPGEPVNLGMIQLTTK